MSFIYSKGELEPTEVKESVPEIAQILSESGNAIFSAFTDYAGDKCIINLINITKIKENA